MMKLTQNNIEIMKSQTANRSTVTHEQRKVYYLTKPDFING